MIKSINTPDLGPSHRLRLNTLVRLRWLAIVGQSVAVLVVGYGLDFPMPVWECFALIAVSAALNLYLPFRYPATYRLDSPAAFAILTFDALQLAGLLIGTQARQGALEDLATRLRLAQPGFQREPRPVPPA